ncbi:thioredoxin family protein [Flavobacterium sp. CYK-4]|uniref:thioredoxin family protein n=1 Tax=Flavobacterium lotistagni TaxID=2709660 RepID=UPI001408EC31|nr:thioredoxin family protein [Flavobacterium lotistagni]NHM07723.1 thioredoxin family protein [Flavobacterium lotistagni]
MKIKFAIFLTLFAMNFSARLSAQPYLELDESGYQSVLQRSKKEHKPIFYMLYATWCTHCNKMKKEVFTDTLVIHFMNKNFVVAGQDIEKGEGEMFKKKYGVKFFPTFVFIDQDGNELYNISGEYKSEHFIAEAKNALTKEKQLPYLEKEFLSDVSNPDKCLAYLSALNKGRDRSLLSPIAHKYLATQTEAQLVSSINWKIIANGVTDIQSREFQYVMAHQKEFEAVASAKRIQRKMENIVTEMLTPAFEMRDTITYEKKRRIAQKINTVKNDSLLFDFDMKMAEKTKNWKKYKAVTLASTDKFLSKNARALEDIASNYLKYVADTESLKYAIDWALQSAKLNETYDSQILLSKLYQKIQNKSEAIAWATKAKNRNAAMGWKTKEADEILLALGQK